MALWDHLFNDIPKALTDDIPSYFVDAFKKRLDQKSGKLLLTVLNELRNNPKNGRHGKENTVDPNSAQYIRALERFREYLSSFYGVESKATTRGYVMELFTNGYDRDVAKIVDPKGDQLGLWMDCVEPVIDAIHSVPIPKKSTHHPLI